MRIRRIAANVAVTALLVGGASLAVAPVASAEPSSDLSPGCQVVNSPNYDALYASTQIADAFAAGERVTVTASEPTSAGVPTSVGFWVGGVEVDSASFPGVLSYTFEAGIDTTIGWVSAVANVTWSAVCDLAPAEMVSGSLIPPWVQGYGRTHAADTCLHGWNPSWELWPHGGTGGWVCTREIPSLG